MKMFLVFLYNFHPSHPIAFIDIFLCVHFSPGKMGQRKQEKRGGVGWVG
jgi:hypothetical protein